jgi:hypothetical protein
MSTRRRPGKRSALKRAAVNSKSASSLDMDKQRADLGKIETDSLTWNLSSEAIPRFGDMQRMDNKSHKVVQTLSVGPIFTTSTSLATFFGLSFTASAHITQFSSFAAVFDQYRIMQIETWVSMPTATLVSNNGLLYSVIDYDNDAAPTNTSTLQNYTNVILSPVTVGHYRRFRPHVAVAAYSGAFSSFKNELADWIDCASTGVAHYGEKFAVDATVAAVSVILTVRVTVQFRNTI